MSLCACPLAQVGLRGLFRMLRCQVDGVQAFTRIVSDLELATVQPHVTHRLPFRILTFAARLSAVRKAAPVGRKTAVVVRAA